MFSVKYLAAAASDFSVPSSPSETCACFEHHETEIEERYCSKQHSHSLDDTEWDRYLEHRAATLFSDREEWASPMLSPLDTDESRSTMSGDYFEDVEDMELVYPSDSELEGEDDDYILEDVINLPMDDEYKNTTSGPLVTSGIGSKLERENFFKMPSNSNRKIHLKNSFSTSRRNQKSKASKKYRSTTSRKSSQSLSKNKALKRTRPNALLRTPSNSSATTTIDSDSDIDEGLKAWKCPHCPWIQRTQRLPDFLRHQRSHFITRTDWPCPNPACGKSFARKDSLKRHLNNRSTPCQRPPGYTVC